MLTYTVTKPVFEEDVENMVECFTPSYSSWGQLYRDENLYTIEYDEPNEDEGSRTGVFTFTVEDALTGFVKCVEQDCIGLCCMENMLTDGIQWGCAQDADSVLQMMLFGELVYG